MAKARPPFDDAVDPAPARVRPAGRERRRWVRRVVLAVLVVALLPVAYVGITFGQVWQASHGDGARPAGAIVVLGAAQYDGTPSPALRNRLEHALSLYEQGLAPLIVVTGGRQQGDRFTEATAGYSYLRKRGVPDEAILKEVQGRTTYESLAAVSRFLRTEGIDDVILVSGRAHTKRLQGIADDLGMSAAISPTDGAPGTRALLRETVAVSAGRLLGYRRLERFDR